MDTIIVVPARLRSTRFPAKLLHQVRGKPIILWTADRIQAEAPEYPLYFAVDGEELAAPLRASGFNVVLTDPDLPSGTDRIAAANRKIGGARVLNVQADEPLVSGAQIRLLDSLLSDACPMATIGRPLRTEREYLDPNHVKLTRANDGRALYFSRAPIPYIQATSGHFDPDLAGNTLLIHLGLYAYTAGLLAELAAMPPSPLEQLERLEMLRALENGKSIAVGITPDRLVEINTPDNISDFEKAIG